MSDSVFFTPSRRTLFKLGGVVAGGAALAACSTKSSSGTASGSAGTLPGIGNNGQVGKGRTGANAEGRRRSGR